MNVKSCLVFFRTLYFHHLKRCRRRHLQTDRTFAHNRQLLFKRDYSDFRSRSYYDLLEITPKASQAQVKAAYYRLSKKYHPDVNKEVDAKQKFTMLSEAYQVLGNHKTRVMYDRGLLNPRDLGMHSQSTSGDDVIDKEYEEFFKKRASFRRKSDIPTGKTSMYDFDEFYRQHYGESVKQTYADKQEYAKFEEEIAKRKQSEQAKMFVYLLIIVASSVAFFFKQNK